MLAAPPVDRQDDLARRLVDVGDDVGDQRPQQPLARARRDARRGPCGGEIVGETGEVRRGRRIGRPAPQGASRASHASTRRSAVSQFFSSCAAIRRLSGSQAA